MPTRPWLRGRSPRLLPDPLWRWHTEVEGPGKIRRMPRASGVLVLLLSSASSPPLLPAAASTGTQPITHEALWLMKRVGSPAVSPDGRWVVFPVTRALLRREEGGARPLDRARGRLRQAPAADVRQGRRERAGLEPRQPPPRLHREARRRRGGAGLRARLRRAAARRAASRRRRSRRAARLEPGRDDDRLPERRLPGRDGRRERTGRSRPSARRRSRRSAATSRSRSGAGTSGWTRRRPTSSWLPRTARRARARPARGHAARGGGGVRRRLRRGLERRPAAGLGAGRPLAGDRGLRQPLARPPMPRRTPTSTRCRSPAASRGLDLGDRELGRAGVRARRLVALRARGRGLGADLRPRPSRVRALAVERSAPRGDRRVRPLGGRLRLLARRAHPVPHRRGRGLVRLFSVPAQGGSGDAASSSRAGPSAPSRSPERASAPVDRRQLGERDGARRDRPHRPRRADAHDAHRLQRGDGRRARLAAARRVLVHERERPAHPQLPGPAARLRRVEEVPALRPDPRRPRQHVARLDHAALELPPARAARATSCS